MPNPPGSSKNQPELFQNAAGEYYYWSERERCYVFQSGHRVATTDGRQIRPADTPRSSVTQPVVSPSSGAAPTSSAISAGSRSPEYTHATPRDRAPSFASTSGSSGHGTHYGSMARAPQGAGTAPLPYRSSASMTQGGGSGLPRGPQGQGQMSTMQAPMAGISINPNSGQVQQYPYYQSLPSAPLGTSPRTQDWYPLNQSRTTLSNPSSAAVSRAPGTPAAPAAPQPSGQARPAAPRREFKATPGDYEVLDPRYRKKPSKFFSFGRVFKMHWSEPDGRAGDDTATVATGMVEPLPKKYEKNLPRDVVRSLRFGEHIYSKIRWFIVVRPGEGKSLCVPIITYGGQGVSKAGVVKDEHAIVHTSKTAPDPIRSELPRRNDEKPMRTAIRVTPDEPGDKFLPMSRIDYGRIYTVESYVKARAFGKVHESSHKDLWYNFREVFLGPNGPSETHSGRDLQVNESDEDDDESEEDNDSDEQDDGEDNTRELTTRPTGSKGKAPMHAAAVAGPSHGPASQKRDSKQSYRVNVATMPSQASSYQTQRPQQQSRTAALPVKAQQGGSYRQANPGAANQEAEEPDDESGEDDSDDTSSDDE